MQDQEEVETNTFTVLQMSDDDPLVQYLSMKPGILCSVQFTLTLSHTHTHTLALTMLT